MENFKWRASSANIRSLLSIEYLFLLFIGRQEIKKERTYINLTFKLTYSIYVYVYGVNMKWNK